jgi:hypothetical protein
MVIDLLYCILHAFVKKKKINYLINLNFMFYF